MSNNNASIIVEGLGKRYLLPHHRGEKHGGNILSHLKEFLPFTANCEDDYFWALRDVTFEVKQGEILGIIGRNGSGKSTLLKILTGVTQPTTGRAVMRGKVGSLLEVGTGFHPDLSGRENVFMAGALLGLRQSEIRAHFDEIVDFSGIEKFIDLPVKRYSSGMYVRLAYAVASMLRSDILILDEVMAVGDAEFKAKSQENIEKIANDGRTVIFVSHNASSIKNLCQTGMVLDGGTCVFRGAATNSVSHYMRMINGVGEGSSSYVNGCRIDISQTEFPSEERINVLRWVELWAGDGKPTTNFVTGNPMRIRIGFAQNIILEQSFVQLVFVNMDGDQIMVISTTHSNATLKIQGNGCVECIVPELRLVAGEYSILIEYGYLFADRQVTTDCVFNAATIEVVSGSYLRKFGSTHEQGTFAQISHWHLTE